MESLPRVGNLSRIDLPEPTSDKNSGLLRLVNYTLEDPADLFAQVRYAGTVIKSTIAPRLSPVQRNLRFFPLRPLLLIPPASPRPDGTLLEDYISRQKRYKSDLLDLELLKTRINEQWAYLEAMERAFPAEKTE